MYSSIERVDGKAGIKLCLSKRLPLSKSYLFLGVLWRIVVIVFNSHL